MPIDTSTPRSPGWWLDVLSTRLHDRNRGAGWSRTQARREGSRPGLLLLRDWYRGDPPLPTPAAGWRAGFGEFLRMSRMNYAALVVEPTRHRLKPVGWRTAVDGDEDGDSLALQVARANDFGVKFSDVAKDMLSLADGYMIVGAPQANGFPLVTAESPLQVITAEDSASGATLAALKLMVDEWDGSELAYVFIPGGVRVARRPAQTLAASFVAAAWEWDEDLSGDLPASFEDVVPVVRFRNRDGVGEFEPHLDTLERINNGILDRVVISKTQAFRQRAIKGLPLADEHGDEIDYTGMFEADPGSLWQVPEGVEFWESGSVDLNSIRLTISDDVKGLAGATSTPLHIITPDAANGSAAGASLMREEHVYKVEDRRSCAGGPLARVMSYAFRFMGESARADVSQIETLWQPAERYSLQEKSNAVAQLWGKLPAESVFTDVLQYPPDALPRLESQRAADLLFAPVTQASAQVAAGGGQ